MKTAIIYDNDGIKLYVVEGDYRHLAGVYINSEEAEERLSDELIALMYDSSGQDCQIPTTAELFAAVIREGAPVIQCGFLP